MNNHVAMTHLNKCTRNPSDQSFLDHRTKVHIHHIIMYIEMLLPILPQASLEDVQYNIDVNELLPSNTINPTDPDPKILIGQI